MKVRLTHCRRVTRDALVLFVVAFQFSDLLLLFVISFYNIVLLSPINTVLKLEVLSMFSYSSGETISRSLSRYFTVANRS